MYHKTKHYPIVFVLNFSVVVTLGMFGCVDRTVTEGRAYGFSIGQSKQEAFSTIAKQIREGTSHGMTTLQDRDAEISEHNKCLEEKDVAQLDACFDRWTQWEIVEAPPLIEHTIVLDFSKGVLRSVKEVTNNSLQDYRKELVTIGDDYDRVLLDLKERSRRQSLPLRARTGWMARRQPTQGSLDEFQLVAPYDRWVLYVGKMPTHFNTIELLFRADRLTSIRRVRSQEMP